MFYGLYPLKQTFIEGTKMADANKCIDFTEIFCNVFLCCFFVFLVNQHVERSDELIEKFKELLKTLTLPHYNVLRYLIKHLQRYVTVLLLQ